MSKTHTKSTMLWFGFLLILFAGNQICIPTVGINDKSSIQSDTKKNNQTPVKIQSSGIISENQYDFSKGTLINVSINENGNLALQKYETITAPWNYARNERMPPGRSGHAMVYDPDTHKIVLFGGESINGDFDDTRIYDIITGEWTDMQPSIHPSARHGHAMVYNSDLHKVVLFGGDDGSLDDETWLYDVPSNTWTIMSPTWSPSRRYGHAMVYDTDSHEVILFGGNTGSPDGTTYIYDVLSDEWINTSPVSSPSARYGHAMVYDTYSHKVLLYGGNDGTRNGETWIYDVISDTWTNLNIHESMAVGEIEWHSMAYDSNSHKAILFGGDGQTNGDETWVFDSENSIWEEMSPSLAPDARMKSSLIYASKSHDVYIFGGEDTSYMDDLWEFSGTKYPGRGQFDSQNYDLEYIRLISGEIEWQWSNSLRYGYLDLQIGLSNSTDEVDFIYTPLHEEGFSFNGTARYFKYRAIYELTDPLSQFGSIELEKVNIEYSLGLPDYMNTINAYLDGNATLLQNLLEWSGENVTILNNLLDAMEDNEDLIQNITTWLEANSTEIASLFTLMQGNADQINSVLTQLDGNVTILNDLLYWCQENATILSNLVLANQDTELLLNLMAWMEGNSSIVQDLVVMLEGNATLLLNTIETLEGDELLIETVMALATRNMDFLTTLEDSIRGNVTQIRDVLDSLGISIGDTDYDNLDDLEELSYGTDPLSIDTDLDNLNDGFEVKIGTNPLVDDTDGDGYYDGIEVAAATDPLSADDYPGKEANTDTTTDTTAPDGDDGGGIPGYPLAIFSLVSVIGLIGIQRSLKEKKFNDKFFFNI